MPKRNNGYYERKVIFTFEKLEEHVKKVSDEVQSMLEWIKTQKDKEWVATEEGKRLILDIGETGRHNAYLYFDMAAIVLKDSD